MKTSYTLNCGRGVSLTMRRLIAAVILNSFFCIVGVLSASAQVRCGSVIGPDVKVSLDTNITACDDNVAAALTIIGPATVDMNNKIVSCSDLDRDGQRPIGIALQGNKVTLRNVGVAQCKIGVLVEGNGKHVIEGATVSQNQEDGFVVRSNGNTLINSEARTNAGAGFFVSGIVKKSNKFIGNIARQNNNAGFVIAGAGGKLSGNATDGNSGAGFVLSGTKHVVITNTASNNDGFGFAIVGDAILLKENTAEANHGIGFVVAEAGKNTLLRNRSLNNSENGIALIASGNTRVSQNTALDNGLFDLADNRDCGANKWSKNIFVTSNQPCIE